MPKLSPLFLDYIFGTSPDQFIERERARYQSMDRASLLLLLARKKAEFPRKLAEVEFVRNEYFLYERWFKSEIANIEAEIARRPPEEAQAPESALSPLLTPAVIPSGVGAPGLPAAPAPALVQKPALILQGRRFRKDRDIRRTPRPLEVLRLLAAHYPQGLIAERLGISQGQVSKLRARLIWEGLLQTDGTIKEPIKDFLIQVETRPE